MVWYYYHYHWVTTYHGPPLPLLGYYLSDTGVVVVLVGSASGGMVVMDATGYYVVFAT